MCSILMYTTQQKGDLDMNADRKDHRASIGFPPDLIKVLQDRARENGRSLSKEVIQLVKAQLSLEQTKREPLQATLRKGENV